METIGNKYMLRGWYKQFSIPPRTKCNPDPRVVNGIKVITERKRKKKRLYVIFLDRFHLYDLYGRVLETTSQRAAKNQENDDNSDQ